MFDVGLINRIVLEGWVSCPAKIAQFKDIEAIQDILRFYIPVYYV